MPLVFPSSPTLGEVFSDAGLTWKYDGEKWVSQGDGGEPGVRYQEGAWTPDTVFNYSVGRDFTWSRVGNVVTISGYLGQFTNLQDTRSVKVSGLPYSPQESIVGFGAGSCQSSFTAVPVTSVWLVEDGEDSNIAFYQSGTGSTDNWSPLTYNDTTASTQLSWTATYITDDTTFVPGNSATVTEDIQGTDGGGGGGGGSGGGSGADAWGSIALDGTLNAGFNVTTSRVTNGKYSVEFITPMPNTNYAVTGGSANPHLQVLNITTDGFTLNTRNLNGDWADNPVYFAVHASSTIAPQYGVGADAWLNADGDGSALGSFNATVTRKSGSAVGAYTVTFDTPMPNANYSVTATQNDSRNTIGVNTPRATGFEVLIRDPSGDLVDKRFSVVVHASSTITPTYTWTREGTTLKPANDGDSVSVDGVVEQSSSGGYVWSHAPGTNTVYSKMYANGSFESSVAPGNQSQFVGKSGGSLNFAIRNDGTTEIGPGGSPNITLDVDGSGTFSGPVSAPNTCTAWVNFAGANGALRGSFNVDGPVTRLGTGRYRIVFSTEMNNSDYCTQVSSNQLSTIIDDVRTSSVDISVFDGGGSRVDTNIICVVVYGGV